ncbi:type II secretion system protein [Bdellovibrio sp.]|uniref:type II secretion system protein n=1 Tax=Bdellovibrio sp. TaxID=28201 RepID=UPI0039E600D3
MMLKNNKGFTAIEVAVGIGLVAILTTVVLTTQLMISRDQIKLSQELENSIDTTLAERIIFTDLNNVDPAYNNMLVKDDSNLPFFDYYPDLPANSLSDKLDREVSLSLDKRLEFYILTQDMGAGPLMNYDPTAAYNIGPTPDDFNTSATLQFVSLNKSNWVSKQRPNFWTKGKALMLDTPARLRPLDSAGKVDMAVAPRSPIYIGSVNGVSLDTDSTIQGLVNVAHPQTGENITTADVFLRRVPSIGGGQSLVRLRAVRLIKYYLVSYQDDRCAKTPAYLYKSVYENGAWSEPFMMADKVAELRLRRDSVLKRMIYFKIKKVEMKKQQQTAGL